MTLFSKKPTKRVVPDDQLRWVHGTDLFVMGIMALMEKNGIEDKPLMDEMKARIKRNNPTTTK